MNPCSLKQERKMKNLIIFICTITHLALANLPASYHTTTVIEDFDLRRPTTFTEYTDYFNFSIDTKYIAFPKASGLIDIISTILKVRAKNETTKDGKNVVHLSQLNGKMKMIFKEIYWNRKLISTTIDQCSKVICTMESSYPSNANFSISI